MDEDGLLDPEHEQKHTDHLDLYLVSNGEKCKYCKILFNCLNRHLASCLFCSIGVVAAPSSVQYWEYQI